MSVLFCFSDSPALAGFFYGLIIKCFAFLTLFLVKFLKMHKQNTMALISVDA